jgi:hypothetical protein
MERAPDAAFQQAVQTANALNERRLREIHDRLLAADESMKTGKREPRLALELLARELSVSGARG